MHEPIHAKSFVNRLYLVLHACVETFDVMFFLFTGFMEWELNRARVGFGIEPAAVRDGFSGRRPDLALHCRQASS